MKKNTALKGEAGFTCFYPGSIVLVTAIDREDKVDICTVGAWALVNGDPIMYGIAMCRRNISSVFFKRYTTICIEQTQEFVINIPDMSLKKAWEICGTTSLVKEPDTNKFERAGLTSQEAAVVKAPLIAECPVNIECKVFKVLDLPSHVWVVGEPVAIHTAKEIIDGAKKLFWESAPRLEAVGNHS